jgi:transposase
MSTIPADLQAFLAEHRDSREYRRGLAVKLALQGYQYAAICEMLDVTPGFVSQAKTAYEISGVDGLRLKYRGGSSFLTDDQRQAVSSDTISRNPYSLTEESYPAKRSRLTKKRLFRISDTAGEPRIGDRLRPLGGRVARRHCIVSWRVGFHPATLPGEPD